MAASRVAPVLLRRPRDPIPRAHIRVRRAVGRGPQGEPAAGHVHAVGGDRKVGTLEGMHVDP